MNGASTEAAAANTRVAASKPVIRGLLKKIPEKPEKRT
jgi:hypothetical protein